MKLIWRIVSHADSLWVRWIDKYLLKSNNFWSVRATTNHGSWMWAKLLKYRAKAKEFCKVEVKNGNRASFWYETWSELGCLMDAVGERGVIDLGVRKNATVAEAWSDLRRRRHRTVVLNQIEETLLSQRHKRVEEADTVLWKGKNNMYQTKFCTRDTWNQIRTIMLNKVSWHNGIWFPHATPKFSFCSWLAVKNRLSTGDRLIQWNRRLQSTCVLCNNNLETRDHLFFSCRFATEVWENLAKNIYKAKYSTNWSALIVTVSGQWQDRVESFVARYLFQTAIHMIWRERNGRRHGEPPNTGARLITWIDKQMRNQITTIKSSGDARFDEALHFWFQSRS
ncbi:unnamed protein product [Arabidopsis halleri]